MENIRQRKQTKTCWNGTRKYEDTREGQFQGLIWEENFVIFKSKEKYHLTPESWTW